MARPARHPADRTTPAPGPAGPAPSARDAAPPPCPGGRPPPETTPRPVPGSARAVTSAPEPRALARPRPGPRGDVPTAADRLPAVLAAFDQKHPALCLTDIGRRAGLSLTTAHRLVGGADRVGRPGAGRVGPLPRGTAVVGGRPAPSCAAWAWRWPRWSSSTCSPR
ncbi:helix-turn-helix domain-containing protein [Streptomyces rochei]|uniref:helix-turn-helix domain-containing protein n=1 Tax=Streptomyces rochei TaxID=1928 RepID=UPI0035D7E816